MIFFVFMTYHTKLTSHSPNRVFAEDDEISWISVDQTRPKGVSCIVASNETIRFGKNTVGRSSISIRLLTFCTAFKTRVSALWIR